MSLTWNEITAAARPLVGQVCKVCPVCDGRACKNSIPGPGAKGVGDTAIRNYEAWRRVRVNMDTLYKSAGAPDTSCELFGKRWSMPLFIAPVGDVNRHYGPAFDTLAYNRMSLAAAQAEGVAAFTGDGVAIELFEGSCQTIKEANGVGVPTVKPWSGEALERRLELVRACGSFAVAMDVDAAGLPFLKGLEPPAGPKSAEQLRDIAQSLDVPFIVKGVMTPRAAEMAVEAGASAIVVSNHGGRVLDQCAATAEVLADIADAMKGSGVKILVDGGIRSGVDVFKALALGADAVLICRPFVPMVYGGAEEGVKLYIEKIGAELSDTMAMCGAKDLASISRDMVLVK